MTSPKKCSLVVKRPNRDLKGTAAQLAHIANMGGWDAFLEHVAGVVMDNFAASYNNAVRESHNAIPALPASEPAKEK